VGFLKRLFGSTDAKVIEVHSTSLETPMGWDAPDVTQTGDEVVLTMHAPGLDPETVQSEVDGSALVVRASGTSAHGASLRFNERIDLTGADPGQADVSYADGKLVVRMPKSAFKPG
jgi:HSP20 family molecular chaperone IbpA